jgi:hypothetical protein
MDYKARFDELMAAARKREQGIAGIGADLLPHVRDLRQKEEKGRLLSEVKRQISELRLSVEKRLREVEKSIREAAYPALMSASSTDRAVGSSEYTAAQGFGAIYPPEEFTREHWGLGRFDFLSALAERAHYSTALNPDAIHERQKFLVLVRELFAERWKELPGERNALQGVMQRIEMTEKSLAVGSISMIPPGEYPGSFAPSVLTLG